ncbi:MAG TPA: type IV secretion system DNA-binding domain-containing protein [Rhizomicrobium sp.]
MLELGTADDGPVVLSDDERARHIHIIGSTGTGKSKLMEHMLRSDITKGRGLCLIDPHGTLAGQIAAWCAARGLASVRKIHLVRPGDATWVAGFNPLRMGSGEAVSVRVDAMVAACAQVWGGQDMNQTPRLKKILRAVFYALAVRKLTLAEALALLSAADSAGARRALTRDLPDPVFAAIWVELNALTRREFSEVAESAINRMAEFLSAPAVRLMIGQDGSTLDFRSIMDAGDIVIVDLGARGAISYENARLVGALIINDLFLSALGRDERTAKCRPFTLYIDEAYDFLSGDVERILDQARKFGLHAVLAHQRIGQLKERGEGVFNAVMGNTHTKIVFGGLSDDDAEVMAREILRSEVDLERPKSSLDKPVVVEEVPVWLSSESESEGGGEASGRSSSRAWASSTGTSQGGADVFRIVEGEQPEQIGQSVTAGLASAQSQGGNQSTTEARSSSWSRTQGRSQTLKPVRVWLPTTTHSLEEELHFARVRLRELPNRVAIVKRRGLPSVRMETPEVRPPLSSPAMAARFQERVSTQSKYLSRVEGAEAALAARLAERLALPAPETAEPESWFEPVEDV